MDDELTRVVANIAGRLLLLASEDESLRGELRTLAGAILAATDRPPSSATAGVGPAIVNLEEPGQIAMEPVIAVDVVLAMEGAMLDPLPLAQPLSELTFARPRPPEPMHNAPMTTRVATADADLPAVEARCRLKAEGLRWATTRRRRIEEGADFRVEIAPRDGEILGRARAMDCFLWMNTPDFIVPREPAALGEVAECFEAVAEAIALVRAMLPDIQANREFFEPALDLMAEAQSALRVKIDDVGGPGDPDQFRAYDWLRGVADREGIYIRHHMRLDDPADPALLGRVVGRIEDLDAKFQGVRGRSKRIKQALNRLRYHAKLIGEGKGGEHDWKKVAGAVDEMVGESVPASNVEIREVLVPILETMPDLDEWPAGFRLVLREVDRYLAGRMSSHKSSPAEIPTPEVAEATRLLRGRCVVLIGGSRRPDSHEALRVALDLKELYWIETREHESIDKFEPYVARPEVSLVLLAIRWSSHSFGEVKKFCETYAKPMVRLPGGYGVNQVAAQIIAQCSGRLG